MVVSIDKFGKDHWSLLAYLETRCVDHKGTVDKNHLRMNGKYPTILKNREKLENHNDLDCISDLEFYGFLRDELTETCGGIVELTDLGIKTAQQIRIHKSKGKTFATFEIPEE